MENHSRGQGIEELLTIVGVQDCLVHYTVVYSLRWTMVVNVMVGREEVREMMVEKDRGGEGGGDGGDDGREL